MTHRIRVRRAAVAVLSAVVLLAAALLPSPTTSVGAYLYEVIRRCPEPERAVRVADFHVIGHRGAAGHAVENTIPSMNEALRLGANAIEIDLCMTRDSAVVLWHDWMPDDPVATLRQEGAEPDVLARPLIPSSESPHHRPTHELTLAELRTHFGYAYKDSTRRLDVQIPRLEEFLSWSAGRSQLRAVYLDIKIPGTLAPMAPAFIARIERALAAAQPSYEVIYLVAAEEVYAAVEPMLARGNISFDREPPAGLVLEPCDNGSAGVALARSNTAASIIIPVTSTFAPWTTARRIIQCDIERAGGSVRVVAGTTNDPEKLRCLVDLGVGGLFVDFPERLRAIVGG